MTTIDWATLRRRLRTRLSLAESTTTKTIASLRILEANGIDLSQPTQDSWETFLEARLDDGHGTNGLNHYRKALRRILVLQGTPWVPAPLRLDRAAIDLLAESILRQLLDYQCPTLLGNGHPSYVEHARFCLRFGFYVACRPPSEHVDLQLDDFDDMTGKLRIRSRKTLSTRWLQLEPWLADDVRTYIADLRNAKAGERALITKPRTGDAWTADGYRMWLTRHGRRVWSNFSPYDLRHAGITWRCIATDFNVPVVQHWAGHQDPRTTMTYIHLGEDMLNRRMSAYEISPFAGYTPQHAS